MDAGWLDEIDTREITADLRRCIDAVRDAFIALDGDGRVVVWNRGAELMFGWPADEVLGGELPWMDAAAPGSEVCALHELARQGVVVGAVPMPVGRHGGGSVLVDVSVDAVRDEYGAVIGTCAVLRDIEGRSLALATSSAADTVIDLVEDVPVRTSPTPGFDDLCDRYDLNPFERDLVALLLTGHRIPTMARTLDRSEGTIRNRLSALYRKFDVGGQTELLVLLHDQLAAGPAAGSIA